MNSITNTDQKKLNDYENDRKINAEKYNEIIERLNNVQHMIAFCEKEVGKICILSKELEIPEDVLVAYRKSLKSFISHTYTMFDWVV